MRISNDPIKSLIFGFLILSEREEKPKHPLTT